MSGILKDLHSPMQSPSPKLGGQYNAAISGAGGGSPEVQKLPAPPPIMGLHPSKISVEFHKPQEQATE
jgi:hypothetical protein